MNDDDLMAEMLLRWDELRERGQDTSAEELCQESPHLLPELTRRLEALRAMEWVDGAADVDGDDPPVDTSGDAIQKGRRSPRRLGGRYRLDKLVAEGGSGQVWQAYDEELQRTVAVKVQKRTRAASRPGVDFLLEGRKVAQLEAPGIVPVYDVGQEDGQYFIVSKFVDGESLDRRLQRNRLNHEEAVQLLIEVARTLEYAHRQGVIHRDIKPGNILLDMQDRPYLADFGIAVTQIELPNAVRAGTLSYMSPEQLTGNAADLDPRSDIYGLGVVLFELLTGRPPFTDDNPVVLREKIISNVPSGFDALDCTAPAELEKIVMRCLAKNPAGRYTSAGDLADVLDRYQQRQNRRGEWRWKQRGVLALTMLTIVTFGWWYFNRPAHLATLTDMEPPVFENVHQNAGSGVAAQGAVVQGRLGHAGPVAAVAFRPGSSWVASGGADKTVRLWDTAKDNPAKGHRLLQQTAAVTALAFKRDGTVLACGCEDGHVRLWDLSRQELKETAVYPGHTGAVTRMAFSPDGMILLTGGKDGAVRLLDFSGTPTKTAALPKEKGAIFELSISDSGTRLIVGAGDVGKQPAEVHIWELDLKGPTRQIHHRGSGILKDVTNVKAMAISPDGNTLLAATETRVPCWSRGQQKDDLELVGAFEKHTGLVNCVAISTDGRYALTGGDDKLIYLWNVKTMESIRSFVGATGPVKCVAYSSDGKRAASGEEDGTVRLWELPVS